jgi:membrane-bound lytic murein transglycosylase D
MMMSRFFFFSIITLFLAGVTGAEERVSYQLDSGNRIEILSGTPVERPLRQIRYAQPYTSVTHGEKPPCVSLSGLDEPETRQFIEQYSTPGGIAWLTTIAGRSELYQGFIRREIEKRGLPQELFYLPVIESAFSTTAVSRVGATGLWQFMQNSIGPYDMKINDWMDERRDFWKSTVGALNKLEDNYRVLGSWELALAAYNAGMGTVTRALRRYEGADYWELCRKKALKRETIQYVPRLLAVSYILSNPRHFGINPSWPEDPQWTRIPIGRSVDLGLVAEHAGLSGTDLKKANGELYYGITPPDPNYHIKVPLAQAAAVAAVLEDPEITLIRYYFHTIHYGDTLSEIAQSYGISVSQITSYNPGLRPQYLKIGQRLVIPALRDVRITDRPRTTNAVSFTGTHLVKKGESLWSIALAYNTDPETLATVNGMSLNDTLREGRALKTPVGY